MGWKSKTKSECKKRRSAHCVRLSVGQARRLARLVPLPQVDLELVVRGEDFGDL